ncbi:MAG: CAP domain-containing protein [Haloarculaceae archaeon]
MVNKAALSVLGVIVLVSMGVGALIGMQLGPTGGGGGDGGPAAGTTQTPVPTDGGGSASATTEPLAQQDTVPPRRFDTARIAADVKRLVNEHRSQQGLGQFQTDGTTVSRIDRMARKHSVAMADAGAVRFTINGTSSADRYRAADLYDTCRFTSNSGAGTIDATDNRLEVIGSTVAGRQYTENGEVRMNRDDEAVAKAIVSNWYQSPVFRDRLGYEHAKSLGVGIEITDDGTVYVTGNLC